MRGRVGDRAKSNLLPRHVHLRVDQVGNEEQIRSAVVPETSIHTQVVVAGICGVRVDDEWLNELRGENSEISRCSLDRRNIAGCGWVLVGLGTWERRSVLFVCGLSA